MIIETEATFSQPLYSDERETSEQNEIVFHQKSQKMLAWEDIRDGLLRWRIWLLLSYQDIRLRYQRSTLGPFWITLSMAITVYSMGYLYSHLFKMNMHDYFPYLVAGMLGWSLVSTTATELVETFTQSSELIRQIKLPYTLYIHKVIMRNFIIFFHNILVIVPILILFRGTSAWNIHLLLLLPGLLLIYANAFCYGIVLSMIGARYRDISQVIKSLIQIAFFLTPVMWIPDILPPDKRFFALINPVYALIEMVRAPMLGNLPTASNVAMSLLATLVGIALSYYLFTRRRARIIYWI
ncbi:MAG TPA: ABC transporter permease [Gammaproteobacteria bacterium]|jgi:ABC-type polysaccharide/polyol phosphate export permease|nr:ABC transporter permease [Gammaproteobacteria bacterium]